MPRRGRFPGCGSPTHAFSRLTRHYLPAAGLSARASPPSPSPDQLVGRLAPTLLAHAHMRACAREGSDRDFVATSRPAFVADSSALRPAFVGPSLAPSWSHHEHHQKQSAELRARPCGRWWAGRHRKCEKGGNAGLTRPLRAQAPGLYHTGTNGKFAFKSR